jgi:ParB family chromosome partitioning protein
MNTLSTIVNISINHLHAHPDNPRKDLGDLGELIDSIKKNGVMQNLTVMPASAINDEPEVQPRADRIDTRREFIVLIGHRRLAAAKKAGLYRLPCRIVSQISRKEQVGIMLEENMQRNDLTILEQAQGFQMMLDLGETEEGIAEKTGFSRTTVRHRLNIAKLDQKLLRGLEDEESGFQLTLTDLYELEAIKDIETRNKILSEANNSRELVWRAHAAVKDEKMKKMEDTIAGMLEQLEIKKAQGSTSMILYGGNYEEVESYDLNKNVPNVVLGFEATEGLCYVRDTDKLKVMRKKDEPKGSILPKEDKRKIEIKMRTKQADEMKRNMDKRCRQFVMEIIEGKIDKVDRNAHKIWDAIVKNEVYVATYNMQAVLAGKSHYELTREEKEELGKTIDTLNMKEQMLLLLSQSMKKDSSLILYDGTFNEETGEKLRCGYAVLKEYGWTFEPGEKELLDGTSELYVRKARKNAISESE